MQSSPDTLIWPLAQTHAQIMQLLLQITPVQ